VRRLERRCLSCLCSRTSSPSHHLPSSEQSAAQALEKLCNHWHQGTAVTAFGRRGSEPMVRTRTGVLPCLWCGLKGTPLYLGDSGVGDDKNYGTRLMEVLGGRALRGRGGLWVFERKVREDQGRLRAAGGSVLCRSRTCCRWCRSPVPTLRATGTQSPQPSPPRGPRRIRALRWLLWSLRIRPRDA
jgi:hypothetical protein